MNINRDFAEVTCNLQIHKPPQRESEGRTRLLVITWIYRTEFGLHIVEGYLFVLVSG